MLLFIKYFTLLWSILMKKRKIYTLPFEILLVLISAFMYALAFPSFINDTGYPIFAFFSFIPLLYAVNTTKWKYTPLLGLIFGVVYLGIFNYWLSTFHPLAIVIGPVAKGIQLFFFFPLLKLSYTFPKKYKAISQSLCYVLYSYIVQQGFLAYAYGSLASTTINLPIIAQLASVTGMWGISFLLFLPQSFITNYLIDNNHLIFSKYIEQKKESVILYLFLFLCVLIYGYSSINYWKYKTPDKYVKIATIQHNADTWKGGYSQYKSNFETLTDLTNKAMELDPDLVMWSETAFVPSVAWHTKYPSSERTSKLVDDFISFGSQLDVPLVTGNVEGVLKDNGQPPFLDNGDWNRDDYNTIILFAEGELKDTYRKQHLVPFTEYFPYEEQFPRFYKFLKSNDYHWWLQSDVSKVFDYEDLKFSTSICFEDIFSDISREFVKNGSTLLLNLSNDSWSKSIAAEQQHMYLGAFRAIENRKSVVRSTNSGITCLITAWGEVIEPITPFTTDYKVYNVPIYENTKENVSFYTKHGDYFVYISFLIIVANLIYRIAHFIYLKTNKHKSSSSENIEVKTKKRRNYKTRKYLKDPGIKNISTKNKI
jgi:apolipoprotein N-acyltransferase